MAGGILALDLATITGWAAWRPSGSIAYGSKKIVAARGSDGAFFAAFDLWLSDMLTVERPRVLVFEAPILRFGGGDSKTSIQTARRLMGLACATDLIAYKREIPVVREVDMQTVRKAFTGRGRWSNRDEAKQKVIEACHARGWRPNDDNAADALCVLDFAMNYYKVPGAKPGPLFGRAPA